MYERKAMFSFQAPSELADAIIDEVNATGFTVSKVIRDLITDGRKYRRIKARREARRLREEASS